MADEDGWETVASKKKGTKSIEPPDVIAVPPESIFAAASCELL